MTPITGRFAPTPSGFAHVGNLFCYLLAWLSAKSRGGRIVLRMEDLDTQRTSRALARETMEDLLWLGLRWDEGPTPEQDDDIWYQSHRTEIYDAWFDRLEKMGLIYPCFCSRTDVKNASAPHASDGRAIYPGTCRQLPPEELAKRRAVRDPAWRLQVADCVIPFEDRLQGLCSQHLPTECGDFPVRRADGVYCYQLAVVVDDALMGVNEVVRASDLLASTPQQIYLYRLLGFPVPQFVHIPTVLDADGKRLAKRDSSISLRDLRGSYTPEDILGRLGFLAGLQPEPAPCTLDALLAAFSWDKVPKEDICMPRGLF